MQRSIDLLQRSIWLGPLTGVVVGLILGLFIGWGVAPVSWTPNEDDVAAMADAYDVNPATATEYAKVQLAGISREEQSRLFTTAIADRNASNRPIEARRITTLAQALGVNIGSAAGVPAGPTSVLKAGTPIPGAAPGTAAAQSTFGNLVPLLMLFVVVALLAAAALVFLTRVLPQLRAGQLARRATVSVAPTATATTTTTTTTFQRPAPAKPVVPSTPPTTAPGGLGRFVASYTLGNDNYDTSFSLETARQEFLGECGMGISETIGEGKPDKVTAFDLWLFDKADVRTVTQIIMSEYAFNDQGLRAKLAAKGEAILAERGKTVTLETQSLRIAAQIVELVYVTAPGFPPNSHFQKLTVEIVPSLKEAVAA